MSKRDRTMATTGYVYVEPTNPKSTLANCLLILKALLIGLEVELDPAALPKTRFVLDRETNKLCIVGFNETKHEEIWLPTEMDLQSFINRCAKMESKQIAIVANNVTLNESK